MDRRQLLRNSVFFGAAAALPLATLGRQSAVPASGTIASSAAPASAPGATSTASAETGVERLHPPARGRIPVAFLISRGAVVIDFCGPWSVFESVDIPARHEPPFHPYTVAETPEAVIASSGLRILPDFTFATAPAPRIIVIPAQSASTPATLDWIRSASRGTDVTMSVCTGAFVLARAGLLDGKAATTHHDAYKDLAMQFPTIRVVRGARFVESGNVSTAGGLSSGIDLSLRVVERYFGRDVATRTAYYMEYQGQGWLDARSNQAYATLRRSTPEHPLCPVCEMEVDPASAPRSVYAGTTYYFCMMGHKVRFDAEPSKFIEATGA